MIFLETRGSWREMGRQYGEATREALRRGMGYFGKWLLEDRDKTARIADRLRRDTQAVSRAVGEEIEGIAQGANLPVDSVWCYRFLPECSAALQLGCTVVALADSDRGPILARNDDIEPDLSVEIQVCHTSRPSDGPASMVLTYAGFLAAGAAMNEQGVAVGGASAHTTVPYAGGQVPFSLFFHLLLHRSENIAQFIKQFGELTYYGKSAMCLVADASGTSVALEMQPGEPLTRTPRQEGRDWQICTNQYIQGVERVAPEVEYLQNSYARYGRLSHRLGDWPMRRTVENVRKLMTEVAAPGLCISEQGLRLRTAYTTIFELRHRKLVLLDGHPSTAPVREVSL